MPSGGYGWNKGDEKMIRQMLEHKDKAMLSMRFEWLVAYASARGAGAAPEEVSTAAYVEWDL